ncbi:MAG: SCO family protein [Zoogloeaceae bacterium]|nr:SCO family protein [Rhodocyclaceae bacterium]MCP5236594.1 SCO family protein [Zoogloeaceae bacterium]
MLIPFVIAAALAGPAFAAPTIDVYALPYPLVDEAGRQRRLADWRGRPTIVAMDHSTWSAVCSSTARRLRALQVAAERLDKKVEFVVIGLEPDKDTPASWARYRQERGIDGDNWHFLRASPADTPNVAASLGVNYRYEYGDLVLDLRILRVAPNGRIERALEGYATDTEAFLR